MAAGMVSCGPLLLPAEGSDAITTSPETRSSDDTAMAACTRTHPPASRPSVRSTKINRKARRPVPQWLALGTRPYCQPHITSGHIMRQPVDADVAFWHAI